MSLRQVYQAQKMYNDVIDNIIYLMDKHNINAWKLSKGTGLKYTLVRNIINRKTKKFNFMTLIIIFNFFNYDFDITITKREKKNVRK